MNFYQSPPTSAILDRQEKDFTDQKGKSMRSENEIREKLADLEEQLFNGNYPDAKPEIDRLKWVLREGPDHIHVPKGSSPPPSGAILDTNEKDSADTKGARG